MPAGLQRRRRPRTALKLKSSTVADVAALLLSHPATTLEGLRAEATAILAMDEAAGYLMDCGDDSLDLSLSLLRDAAGPAFRPLDERISVSKADRSGGDG